MATKKQKVSKLKKPVATQRESDTGFFLKLVLFFILGTFWVRLLHIEFGPFEHLSLPAGLVIGLVFASHERFQIDRKIEYAILLGATFISFYLPVGITV
jgi:Na+/H+ antiporter NhaC